jgi:type III restriction enzyme
LRIVETLHYHSAHNPDYITEIKSALTEMGILAEKYVQRDLFIKDSFKNSDFWKDGMMFINDRVPNQRTEIFSLDDARIERNYQYKLRTGELKEDVILEGERGLKPPQDIEKGKIKFKFSDFGENIIRSALDKFEFYKFETLKKYFPHIKSVREFVLSPKYLGEVEIEVSGQKNKLNKLTPIEKLEVALFVVRNIAEKAKVNTSEFKGTNLFKARLLRQVFKDKKIKIDIDELKNKELKDVNLAEKDWYAQNEFYGTDEEQKFISFIDGFIEKLRQRYSDIALLRNEKFFQVFEFDEGRPFEPDFIMFLKKRNKVISIYQIFIEPKGDQFKDSQGRFKGSKEGWKQDFLLELENKAKTDLKLENKYFKLIGLPFYNEKLKKEFEEALENKILS